LLEGKGVDISQQVEKILKDMETREKRHHSEQMAAEATLLMELTKSYSEHVNKRQWEHARECLRHIARLVVSIACE
jgi:hypothetical protein